ncbi:G2/mitotic-specific cyclin [Lachnellula occidentalis]|uniref:G2/mitotic-specific cyclin n=1 Tax=Lachnellula occidentalis TaxID=215460 RepID=A0A8H8S3M1_9HELO|nr:G2/mitotic-specific cyclin [Lachnellula occidentalis]
MDARPQRPVRALRLQGDENIAPSSKQTLHQRHKSTGTLSNMLAIGGLKAAAKRTAFGDVSNTAKSLATIHDDSVLPGKSVHSDFVKPLVPQDKPAAFLRPAQRPLNVAPIKGPLNITSSTMSEPVPVPAASKAPPAEPRQPNTQLPAIRRTQSKKLTSIYKDSSTENEQQPRPPVNLNTRPEVAPIPPVQQALEPRQHKSQPQLKTDPQPVIRKTQSKYFDAQPLPEESEKFSPTEAIYETAREDQATTSGDAYESYRMVNQGKEEEPVHAAEEVLDRQHRQIPAPSVSEEPEEYWEDEEEEIYDEQGYTTAHSYRSKGDNTTGGATTVLFPKVTNKAKKEIAAATEVFLSTRTQEDIEEDEWDTSMVTEYGDEIFAYMRELEIKMLPNAHYMDNQAEIQWSMRSVLMDWLIQVHHRFSLLPETLFLCVNYIDRFLSCKIVSLGKLQLVGATAIFVAAKYEEINCPSVNEIVYMVDGGYTVDEILKAERFMLSMLSFELGWPGPMSFLRRISKADEYDLETRTLAKYFLEVTVMDERFVGCPPSYIAAGAHCFSRWMLKKGDWTPAHIYYSGYTWGQLRPLVSMMMECCEHPLKHHAAVFEKYSDRRYKKASTFVKNEMEKGFVLPSIQMSNFRPSLPSLEDVAAQMPFETRDSLKRMVQIKG